MADSDKQTQQQQSGQDKPVIGYPVIAACTSPNWGNASLVNHPAESTYNMTTMKRLYGAAATAGQVKQLPPWHEFVVSSILGSSNFATSKGSLPVFNHFIDTSSSMHVQTHGTVLHDEFRLSAATFSIAVVGQTTALPACSSHISPCAKIVAASCREAVLLLPPCICTCHHDVTTATRHSSQGHPEAHLPLQQEECRHS
jgi:hypothetical protein